MTLATPKFEIVTYNNVEHYSELPDDVAKGVGEAIHSAFGGIVTPEDAQEHMTGNQLLVAVDNEAGKVAGFTSTVITSPRRCFGEDILTDQIGVYFAGAAVARQYQGRGLYHQLNEHRLEFALHSDGGDRIFTRTQNPRVVEGLTGDMQRLTAQRRIGGFTMSTVISQGAYGQMLTAEKPVARDLVLDLDYERGDAAVVTWHLTR